MSPIALYPDVLVAQILAGSTYPTQVVEATRWVKENPGLTGDALAAQVNQQPWDPSIKSLTQFPSVLQTMNDNLSWTSSLGEAYYNQPADVMNAIQVLRNKAMAAGNLKSTAQQTVDVQPAPPAPQGSTQPSVQQTVVIQPAQPNTVYVPQYNPTTAYGAPVAAPAGYSGSDLLLTGVLSFGAGILLGSLINDGHNSWGCNWGGGYNSSVVYNRNVYVSNNNVYPGRYPAGGYPAGGYPRPPGYRPPNGGQYPRPAPYPGGRPPYNGGGARPGNPAIPTTRPYNPNGARPNNPNFATPKFPKASTLPNGGRENLNGNGLAQNQPGRRENPGAATRPAGGRQIQRARAPQVVRRIQRPTRRADLRRPTIPPVVAMVRWVDTNPVVRRRLPASAADPVSEHSEGATLSVVAAAIAAPEIANSVAAAGVLAVAAAVLAVAAGVLAAAVAVGVDEDRHE